MGNLVYFSAQILRDLGHSLLFRVSKIKIKSRKLILLRELLWETDYA